MESVRRNPVDNKEAALYTRGRLFILLDGHKRTRLSSLEHPKCRLPDGTLTGDFASRPSLKPKFNQESLDSGLDAARLLASATAETVNASPSSRRSC